MLPLGSDTPRDPIPGSAVEHRPETATTRPRAALRRRATRAGGADPAEPDAASHAAGAATPRADGPRRPAAAGDSADAAPSGPQAASAPASVRDGMITVEDHLERILRGIGPLEAYDQPLVESLGLPLHENFVAPIDLPRFDNSAMDGYAVRAEDVAGASPSAPVTLPVVGEIVAGSAKPFAISAGTAVKIMTGAPIPRGADAVIPFEQTDRGNARVEHPRGRAAGRQHPHAGQRRPGRRPRAAEPARSSDPARSACWPRSARHASRPVRGRASSSSPPAASCASPAPTSTTTRSTTATATCWPRPCAPPARSPTASAPSTTTRASFRKVLSEQLVRADLVVTSGGVSKGEKDVVKETLSALGTVVLRQGRDAAGQAAGLRPGLRRADARSSRCRATRSRPTSRSRCSCCRPSGA